MRLHLGGRRRGLGEKGHLFQRGLGKQGNEGNFVEQENSKSRY